MSQIPESRRLLAGLLSSEKKTKAGFKCTVKKERTGRQTMENQLHAQMFSRASKVSLDASVLLVRRNNFGSQECIQTSVMNICPVQSYRKQMLFCFQSKSLCYAPVSLACLAPSLPDPLGPGRNILHHVYSCFPLFQHTRHPVNVIC